MALPARLMTSAVENDLLILETGHAEGSMPATNRDSDGGIEPSWDVGFKRSYWPARLKPNRTLHTTIGSATLADAPGRLLHGPHRAQSEGKNH